jgi:hypothetical protein
MAHKIGPENAKMSQLMKSYLESFLESCLRTISTLRLLARGRSPSKLFAHHGGCNACLDIIIFRNIQMDNSHAGAFRH